MFILDPHLAPRSGLAGEIPRARSSSFPEITGVYRMSGDLDYVLRARVSDVKAYDRLYQRLIAKVPLSDVSASFVMEEIKETTASGGPKWKRFRGSCHK